MEMTLSNRKIDEDSDKDFDRKSRQARVRTAYKRSGLNYEQLSILLRVKRNTLANWLTKTGRRVPPEYVVQMIEDKVAEYLENPYEITKEENENA